MCAETIVETTNGGQRVPTENDLKLYIKRWDKQYGMTYLVLDILQRVFYRTDATREAFVEMCSDKDVQKMTFDSYLYKTVVPANPLVQMKITAKTIGSLLRGNALAP
jgi:geranylgeranyl reductase